MNVESDYDAMMAQAQTQRGRGETTVPDKYVLLATSCIADKSHSVVRAVARSFTYLHLLYSRYAIVYLMSSWSPMAYDLLQMLKHGRAGVPMEVMGLMLGEFVDEYTVQVIDVFAMPQSGTTVSVESVDHVFQTKMVEMLKQTGRYVLGIYSLRLLS